MKSQEHLLDFEVVQSDTKTFRFFVKRNHIPFDITGYEFFFTVKKVLKILMQMQLLQNRGCLGRHISSCILPTNLGTY